MSIPSSRSLKKIIIQLFCPDQKGIISRLTSILFDAGLSISSIQQYIDREKGNFYMRLAFMHNLKQEIPTKELLDLNEKLNGKIEIIDADEKLNVAILGTKESEPVYHLLIKNKSKELKCSFPVLISNHNQLSNVADKFNIDFFEITDNEKILKTLKSNKIDLVVLARYMQIIPESIIKHYKNKIINIHHGFLPAFKGAKPYHQAYEKGVKIIGATAHYVTNDLDEGPIIYQDTIHINHKHSIKDFIQLGRQIEKGVLYKAVKSHLDYKVIVFDNKTIIFD